MKGPRVSVGESENEPSAAAAAAADWTLREYEQVDSTNLAAAKLPAWTAVRADTQTAGRGRFQRGWVSDLGGLWLSAVVPLEAAAHGASALPLATGLAISDTLRGLGVAGLRMRWPNDLLVEDRKLAGLLIDRFVPGLAVIGIGINVSNHPEARDPALAGQTARLADLMSAPPDPSRLAGLVLGQLRRVACEIQAGRFDLLLPAINALWGRPRQVELDLDGDVRDGLFEGVDRDGRLLLRRTSGKVEPYAAGQVRHLKEIINLQ